MIQAPPFWLLGWRTLRRDWRAGDLRVLVLAITLAVAALTAVGFFSDRLQAGLHRDARALIGGDAVVRSDHPPPPAYRAQAQALGLRTSLQLTFATMGRAPDAQGGAARLVALKAVATGYPLRGAVTTTTQPDQPAEPGPSLPEPGTAWVDPAVLDALDLRVGQSLLLGDGRLRIARVIVNEPDRGAGFMGFAPRVMINAVDLPATALVQPGSRIAYRLAVAGDDGAVRRYVAWVDEALKRPDGRGMGLESLDSGRPEMQQTLGRAEKFLNLVALLVALLSAVAVAIASRVYTARHLDDCAMLRVLGLPQRTMARAYAFAFMLAGVGAGMAGAVLGFAVHLGFVRFLSGLLQTTLPAPGVWPALLGMGVALTLTVAFGLPPVLQLARVPPLRVIRRDVGQLKPASLAVVGLGALGFAALLLVVSRDIRLGVITVGGFAAAVALFAGVGYGATRLLRVLVNRVTHAPHWLRLAARQLGARPAFAVVQISALAVGLLALVLLVLLRTDLVSSWRQATPPDGPNRYIINIQPDQADALRAALRQAGVVHFDWYPMIRGRLVAINGRAVRPQDYPSERAQRLVDREFNLSHSAEQPDHNPIVAGRWLPDEPGAISVEAGLAETLGLHLGDHLTFDIAGVAQESTITSLRKVDWGSMRVNFFALYPVSRMPDVPLTYISAFRAPMVHGFDNRLVHQFPNITDIDMTTTLNQVQGVVNQVIRAVEALFAFALAAGLVVLLATLTATRSEREQEYAIMRAVGAQAGFLRRVQGAELAAVGALAGLLASLVAMAVGWALAHYAFDFDWRPSAWTPLVGAVTGMVLALAAGWWSLRALLRASVVQTLRQAAV